MEELIKTQKVYVEGVCPNDSLMVVTYFHKDYCEIIQKERSRRTTDKSFHLSLIVF